MPRQDRLGRGDRVEVIDRNSSDFGKIGELLFTRLKDICVVKLYDTGMLKEFVTGQLKKL